jgi:hypothetical protein
LVVAHKFSQWDAENKTRVVIAPGRIKKWGFGNCAGPLQKGLGAWDGMFPVFPETDMLLCIQ